MIRWFVENKVAANLLMVAIIVGGLYAINARITFETFPTVESDVIEVVTVYDGASPEQIDQLINIPIEQAIESVDDISRISSFANEGSGRVVIELERGADKDKVKESVEQEVDTVTNFPAEAEDPEVSAPVRKRRTARMVLSGDIPVYQMNGIIQNLERKYSAIPGISSTEINGLKDREFSIWVEPEMLEKNKMSLVDLNNAISAYTSNFSLGSIDSKRGRILMKSDGQATSIKEYRDVVVKVQPDGSVLRLGDIAEIVDSFEPSEFKVTLDGKPAVFLNVYQTEQANILDLSKAINELTDREQAKLPEGVQFKVSFDSSTIFKSRLNTLVSNGIQGGFLVLLALALLLRLRMAVWVAVGIPIAFLGGFLMMPVFDVSLNMISMFGYILVLGIVVDDAIVTAENVYVHQKRHGDQVRAAIEGTQEIAAPVTFGVLTTVAAMLPFLNISGRMGSLFAYLAIVVISVLAFSLVESKIILPTHLAHINRDKPNFIVDNLNKVFGRIANDFESMVLMFYRPMLKFCLNNVGITLGAFLAALIVIIALPIGGKVPVEFFPRIPGDSININVTMPTGTPYAQTLKAVERLESAAVKLKEKYADGADQGLIRDILVQVGQTSPESGLVEFDLAPEEVRNISISNTSLSSEWKALAGQLPGVEKLSIRTQAFTGGGSDVALALVGNDVRRLKEAGDIIKDKLAGYEGVNTTENSLSDGRLEIDIQLTAKALSKGVRISDIASQLRAAMNGSSLETLLLDGDEVNVVIRFPEDRYDSIAELKTMPIKTATGMQPLATLVNLSEQQGSASVIREDGRLLAVISAKVDEEQANAGQIQAAIEKDAETLLLDYPNVVIEQGSDKAEEQETNQSIYAGMIMSLFLIYVLLAIPFRSYGKPFIVISIIPFGLAGAVLGHYIWGSALYMPSMLGMLALIGILVNDSLVLVDYINKRYEEIGDLKSALLEAGVRRFRPIFLTTLTTVCGVMPLCFETSLQAQFLIPMAISLGFGIFFGTLVTLFLVPVNYAIYEFMRPIFTPAIKLVSSALLGALVVWSAITLGYQNQIADLLTKILG
jgi:multidrug efflux pump subunit AcrB